MKKVILLLCLCLIFVVLGAWKGRLLLPSAANDLSPEMVPFYLITFSLPESLFQPEKNTSIIPLSAR